MPYKMPSLPTTHKLNMTDPEQSLVEFPCQFPIKAMGKDENEFVAHVLNLVSQHYPELSEEEVHTRPSSGGKYISVTATITATSQEQLDAIYYALTASERVIMAL